MDQTRTEGERWTANVLSTLRDARFTPDAIAAFLRASFTRAAATRAQRPALARQSRRWVLAGALGTLGLRRALIARSRPAPSRRALACWIALEALMLDWHLGMVEGVNGEPRGQLRAADALTLTRFALTPFVRAAGGDRSWFVALLALGGASDLLDGMLARHVGETRFGRDFDSLADSAFRLAALRCAQRAHGIDRGPCCALIARQVLMATDGTWQWFGHSRRPRRAVSSFTRRHVPLLFTGLAAGAYGHRTAAGRLLDASVALAGAHARAPAAEDGVPQAFWDSASVHYARQHWLEHASIRTAIELLAPVPDERLLDLGTGTGELLRMLAARPGMPREAHGIDRSAAMLGHVPPLPAGWSVSRGDARATRFATGEFDMATACYLLHVLSACDRQAVLGELWRVLGPGGRLAVVTPAIPAHGVGHVIATALDRLAVRSPARWRGLRALDPRDDLVRAGFEVLDARFSQRGYVAICVLARRPDVASPSPEHEPGSRVRVSPPPSV